MEAHFCQRDDKKDPGNHENEKPSQMKGLISQNNDMVPQNNILVWQHDEKRYLNNDLICHKYLYFFQNNEVISQNNGNFC